MKILVLTRYDRLGASSRIRYFQYFPYLETQGIDVTVSFFLDNEYLKRFFAGGRRNFAAIMAAYGRRLRSLLKARSFDLLWIEKEVLPWLPAWAEWWLVHQDIPYVVDYDDALFHRYDQHVSPVVRTLLSRKIDAVMRRADLVIVGNDYLAAHAHQAGAHRVKYLPSVVDLARYKAAPQPLNQTFTIGWIGSPVTAKYLGLVRDALAAVCGDGGTRVVLIGSGETRLEGVSVEVRPWSEDTEVAELQDVDVGIMPLPDQPWERGKSGYKLIQYMACARPVVASPVGMNRQIVENGVNGFLAMSIEEWTRALRTLRDDSNLRARMGRVGRRKIEREYCLQITAPKLCSLLRSVSERRHGFRMSES